MADPDPTLQKTQIWIRLLPSRETGSGYIRPNEIRMENRLKYPYHQPCKQVQIMVHGCKDKRPKEIMIWLQFVFHLKA